MNYRKLKLSQDNRILNFFQKISSVFAFVTNNISQKIRINFTFLIIEPTLLFVPKFNEYANKNIYLQF